MENKRFHPIWILKGYPILPLGLPWNYDSISSSAKHIGITMPTLSFSELWLSAILLMFAMAFFQALYELWKLHREFSPEFKIKSPKISWAKVSGVPFGTITEANYVHLIISNIGEKQIDRCSVNLVACEKLLADGTKQVAPITNPITLITASKHQQEATVYPKLDTHFDIAVAFNNNQFSFCPKIHIPNVLLEPDFLSEHGTYMFSIVVAGENVPSIEGKIKIVWNGNWKEIAAGVVE